MNVHCVQVGRKKYEQAGSKGGNKIGPKLPQLHQLYSSNLIWNILTEGLPLIQRTEFEAKRKVESRFSVLQKWMLTLAGE